jgi:2-polyprenyl-3-methyl-5-hydroxy-6-metoxy-1,4-benzoquinol methylase
MTEDTQSRYTKAEIEDILQRKDFVYQRIELPYGLATRGEDRSDTARQIFPGRLDGKSILDVGCCYGFFLYEAEKLGAGRLVGTELNPNRFRQAELIRDIRGSSIEFLSEDFETLCARESFDIVLFLNVVHHLRDPIGAVRLLAAAAREQFIMEFPTPSDPKFRKLLAVPGSRKLAPRLISKLLDKLPVIGVSSLESQDQTFVFSEKAVRAIVLEHEPIVDRITFVQSPKPGRMIAICDKTQSS